MLTPRGGRRNAETQTQTGEGESDLETAKPSHLSGEHTKQMETQKPKKEGMVGGEEEAQAEGRADRT